MASSSLALAITHFLISRVDMLLIILGLRSPGARPRGRCCLSRIWLEEMAVSIIISTPRL